MDLHPIIGRDEPLGRTGNLAGHLDQVAQTVPELVESEAEP
jgi:hypothetical protein